MIADDPCLRSTLDVVNERYVGWHVRYGTAVKRHEKFLLAVGVSRLVPSGR